MSCKQEYDPVADTPEQAGKVFLVTGGTSGLGKETVLLLAALGPAHIFFTGRNATAAGAVEAAVRAAAPNTQATFLAADHTDLASVQSAARAFAAQADRLDALVCNAGIMAVPPGRTHDGFEVQFGVNHVAHALWVKFLTPQLRAARERAGDARVVLLSSLGFGLAPGPRGIDLAKVREPDGGVGGFGGSWARYGQAKLANVVYAAALAEHCADVATSVAVHPGTINTELVTRLGWAQRALVWVTNLGSMKTPREGAFQAVWASTAPRGDGEREVKSGTFYEPVGVKGRETKFSKSEELREELWRWTEAELAKWET